MYKDFDLTIDHVTKILIPKYKVAALPCLIICDMIVILRTHKLIEKKGLKRFLAKNERSKRHVYEKKIAKDH